MKKEVMDYTKLIKREKSALHLALEKEEENIKHPPIVYLNNNSKKLDFESFCEKHEQDIEYIINCYYNCLKSIPKSQDIKFKLMDHDFYNDMKQFIYKNSSIIYYPNL